MQSINLYHESLYHISESLLSLFRLVGVAILAMTVVSVGLFVNLELEDLELDNKLKLLKKVTRTHEAELSEIQITKEDAALINKIVELKTQRERKKSIADLIQNHKAVVNYGFHQALHDLYENDTENVWLKEIHIMFPGPKVKLVGWLKHPQDLPVYIENLRYSPTFSNIEYDVFDISTDPDNPNYLQFVLATEHEQLRENVPDSIEQIFRAIR